MHPFRPPWASPGRASGAQNASKAPLECSQTLLETLPELPFWPPELSKCFQMASGTVWASFSSMVDRFSKCLGMFLEDLWEFLRALLGGLGRFGSAQLLRLTTLATGARVPLWPPDLPNSIHIHSFKTIPDPQAFKDLWKQPEGSRRQGPTLRQFPRSKGGERLSLRYFKTPPKKRANLGVLKMQLQPLSLDRSASRV